MCRSLLGIEVAVRLGRCMRDRRALLATRGVVLPRELPRRLDGLRPARDEEEAVEIPRRQRGDLGRELDCAWMRVGPVRVERQLAHLRSRGFPHLLAVAVADV